jgi:Surp module
VVPAQEHAPEAPISQQSSFTAMKVLMERESANPEFGFMFNLQSPEHMYFRWRLYSLSQGMQTVQLP